MLKDLGFGTPVGGPRKFGEGREFARSAGGFRLKLCKKEMLRSSVLPPSIVIATGPTHEQSIVRVKLGAPWNSRVNIYAAVNEWGRHANYILLGQHNLTKSWVRFRD